MMSLIDKAFDAFESGELSEAEVICKTILANEPDDFGAHYLVGSIYGEQKRWAEAAQHLERATKIRPDRSVAFFNLANVLRELGRLQDALSAARQASILMPDDVEALLLRATLENQSGRPVDAEATSRNLLGLDPQSVDGWIAKGNALLSQFNGVEALAAFDRALNLDNTKATASNGRAEALILLHEYDQALKACDDTLALDPKNSNAHRNKATIFAQTGRLGEAIVECEKAIALKPDFADAYLTAGNILQEQGEEQKAMQAYEAALAIAPGFPEAEFNKSTTLLRLGDFAQGWAGYERRFDIRELRQNLFGTRAIYIENAQRCVEADALRGRKVLVIEEQGVGDVIMFASILRDLLTIASDVEVAVNARLTQLLQRSFTQLRVCELNALTPQHVSSFDVVLFIGSLGYTFRREPHRFPKAPYLIPDAARVQRWRARLPNERKRIGISWRGGTIKTKDGARSLDLATFASINSADLQLVSLQHGNHRDEIERFNASAQNPILHFDPKETHDLDDLAALIASLDAVVTVQNTNVHLSGALGKRCYALIPGVAEWRYGSEGSAMNWYSSVELFRNSSAETLAAALSEIRNKL